MTTREVVKFGHGWFAFETCRHWLPVADKQIGARPELAGVGIATDVLDALKWAA